jgi:hypothetical protein
VCSCSFAACSVGGMTGAPRGLQRLYVLDQR